MHFDQLHLDDKLLRAIAAEGYTTPTPIQAQAIPYVLAGRDLLGVAQTGTGKTAAFSLPMLQRLAAHAPATRRHVRALVLTPTRELAAQIGESIATYGRHMGLSHTVVFGGVGLTPQEQTLRRGVDILVATPGRLLDLMGRGVAQLDRLEVFVLDEADRMLDMGFIHDVRRVISALPKKRQSLFFSATMPSEIVALAGQILTDPAHVAVTPVSSTAEKVEQHVYFVEHQQKKSLLIDLLSKNDEISRAIVFTRTKHGANRVAETLAKAHVGSAAIHGNKSQGARERALAHFRDGTIRVLVATDIAARGIDVEGVSHVINYELPNVPEQYVHRIGRTARAGASGIAISFCEHEEREYLADIERLTKQHVKVVTGHEYESPYPPPRPTDLEARRGHSQPAARPQQVAKHDHRAHARPQPVQTSRPAREPGPRGASEQRGRGQQPARPKQQQGQQRRGGEQGQQRRGGEQRRAAAPGGRDGGRPGGGGRGR